MYKSRLQELCQQQRLPMPKYDTEKTGLDHFPRFRASVTVNGLSFTGPRDCGSAKEAQNEAAKAAFLHFSTASNTTTSAPPMVAASAYPSSPPSSSSTSAATGSNPPLPLMPTAGVESPGKNQLQVYAQKRNLDLPSYECFREGSFHASRYKAQVTVGGQTFESPQSFKLLKEAENAAARVALMSLSGDGYEDIVSMYKNLLLELTQKEGLSAPVYETSIDGPPHIPVFSSTVLIKGERFNGTAAKTKKQAEQNAAKVAWCALKERKSSRRENLLASFEVSQDIKSASSGAMSAATDASLLPELSPETSSGSTSCILSEDCRDGSPEDCTDMETSSNVSLMDSHYGQHKAVASSVNSGSQSNDFFASDMEELLGDELPLNPAQSKSYANMNAIGLAGVRPSSKNQLQIYAQKRNLNLPTYECVREGSLHSLRYKAKVTVEGQTFESPQSFNLLKEAENAAATVALMSLSVDGNHEDSIPLYKNLLLELAQKEGLATPIYVTSAGGRSHIPTFTSTVQIVGEMFNGTAAKTKKQAEQNAAKVAWSVLKERKSTRRATLIPSLEVRQNVKIASSSAGSAATDVFLLPELSQPEASSGSTSCIQPTDCRNGFSEESTHIETSSSVRSMVSHCPLQETAKSSVVDSGSRADNALAVFPAESEESVGDGSPLRPVKLESHANVDAEGKVPSSLPHCRVQVYPWASNFVLPEGGSLLPFSDDKWVAVSFDSAKS